MEGRSRGEMEAKRSFSEPEYTETETCENGMEWGGREEEEVG